MAAEAEEQSPMAIGIAATLIGSISFQMALFYLTNHPDKDMRKYSYSVINQTVSIFCAVLMFQCCDDIVELFMEGQSEVNQALVDMLHMLLWFTIMQIVLAVICNVDIKSFYRHVMRRASVRQPPKEVRNGDRASRDRADSVNPQKQDEVQQDSKCWAVLLAHLTGFASINAWGAFQQLEVFRCSPIFAFAVVPISSFGLWTLQWLTDAVREELIALDGDRGEAETAWDDETEEAENDVMALTLSFNLTQAIRFSITNHLPDQHGKEPGELLHSHNLQQVLQLFAVGLACVPAMVVIFENRPKGEKKEESEDDDEEEEEDSEEDDNGEEREAVAVGGRDESSPEAKKNGDKEFRERVIRAFEALTMMFAMAFAWCLFYSAQMALATIKALENPMVLAVTLTLFISFAAFSCIRLLDLVDDFIRGSTDKYVMKSYGGKYFQVPGQRNPGLAQEDSEEGKDSTKALFIVKEYKDYVLLMHGHEYLKDDGTLTKNKSEARLKPHRKGGDLDSIRLNMGGKPGGRRFKLIAKANKNTKKVDVILKNVIRALGILVGFGWEQCFDTAVETLSEVLPMPHVSKLLLGLFCVLIIVPAWKWYVLPMSLKSGWKFGFVVDHQDEKWHEVVAHIGKRKGRRGSTSILDIDADPSEGVDAQETVNEDGRRRGSRAAGRASLSEPLLEREKLRNAAEGFLQLYLQLREAADADRHNNLRAYNRQMDSMLAQMRTLQAQVSSQRGNSAGLPVADALAAGRLKR